MTIPAAIRELDGLLPHTEVDFEFDGKVVRRVLGRIVPAQRDIPEWPTKVPTLMRAFLPSAFR